MTPSEIIEIFAFLILGQVVHILTKMSDAKKQAGKAFAAKIYLADNSMILLINVILIFVAGTIYARSGISTQLEAFGTEGDWWKPFAQYILYFGSGYFIQSLFNFLLKGFARKSGIEIAESEKTDDTTNP